MWVFVVVVCCNLLDFVVAICEFFNTVMCVFVVVVVAICGFFEPGDVGLCCGGRCDLWVTGCISLKVLILITRLINPRTFM